MPQRGVAKTQHRRGRAQAAELVPREAEVHGLVALMELLLARGRACRGEGVSGDGDAAP